MRRVAFVLLFCLAPLPAAALIGGTPAPSEIAAQTVLIVSTRGASCTGAVLAFDLVLTAAHCVQPQANYVIAVIEPAGPRLVPVERIILHPRFNPAQFETRQPTPDLALLKLAVPLPARFKPARLARDTALPRVGERFTLAGYGVAAEGNEKSAGTLRVLELPAIGNTGGIMVRLSAGATRGACTGDSGGPVFRGGLLVAVIGWASGPKAQACGPVTGATLVALQREWIVSTARALGIRIAE